LVAWDGAALSILVEPTVRQRAALEALLDVQCELYNAASEERRGAWRWEHRSVSYVDQCRTLTTLRESRPEVQASGVTVSAPGDDLLPS